jgi:type III pantothenate kinase
MLDQLKAQLALAAPGVALAPFTSGPSRAGLRNGYRMPSQLGSDRFAAAIGARFLYPGQKLVVATCGTATTVDAVDGAGVFLGGMILPGLGLMAASLARNTAQLPQVPEHATLPAGFADNTDDAILAGCINAQAGAIERACAQLTADLCLLSGGAARYVAPALAVPHRLIDNIVLLGLHAASLSKE